MNVYSDEEFRYSFITFNYTNVLDRIIGLYDEKTAIITKHQGQEFMRSNKIGQIIHIHGTTDEEMILGVNDAEQIGNDLLKKMEFFWIHLLKGE